MERNLISAQMSMKHAILMPNSPGVCWLCFDSAAWKDNNTTEPHGALCYPGTELGTVLVPELTYQWCCWKGNYIVKCI